MYHDNTNCKKSSCMNNIIISHKADFKPRRVIRNEKGHHIVIKESIFQEAITTLNMCASNQQFQNAGGKNWYNYRVIDEYTTIAEDFNTSLSEMDKSSKQKVNEDIVEFKSTINQLHLTDPHRLCHQQQDTHS